MSKLRKPKIAVPAQGMKVGKVAERARVGVQTLHYYERLGLLPKPKRSAANYRLYSQEALRRVQFIKKAQAVGLTLEEIRQILDLKDRGRAPCRKVAEVGARRLREIDAELAKLRAFRRALAAALPQWQAETATERTCAAEFCDLIENLPEPKNGV
jgi:DNA-binding transcriptional MerR regulator